MQSDNNISTNCPYCKKRMDWLEEGSMGVTLKGKRSEDVSVYFCPHCKTFLGLALDYQADLQAIEEMLQNLPHE